MDINLIVPTYNEAENIPLLVELIFKNFEEANLKGGVVIVDDNSPDETWKKAETLKKSYAKLEVTSRLSERGAFLGSIRGLPSSSSKILGVMDADLSHPPEKIPELVNPILKGEADFVIGSRFVNKGKIEEWSFSSKMSSRLATLAACGLTGVKDPMSGFFFLKRDVTDNVELNPKGFKIGLEILVRGNYDRVIEIPIMFRDRMYGETKLNSSVILDYLIHVTRLYIYKIF